MEGHMLNSVNGNLCSEKRAYGQEREVSKGTLSITDNLFFSLQGKHTTHVFKFKF